MNKNLEAAIEGALARPPTLRRKDLPCADLKGQDLTKVEGLLPEDLAGLDLTGVAKLPDEIAKFPALGQVAAISSEARKVFIGLLGACVYSWLVIGTTTDVALIVNTASSPLPIINTPIPIAGFYAVGASLLAAVYCYFHFYLQRLWRTLATLPAIFPDGTPLNDKTDPWLLTNLVRADFKQLRRTPPPLARMENLLTILLAWWLVPLTLLALWARYLPAHYWLGTTWLIYLIGVTAMFGRHSYRLARATLRGETPAPVAEGDDGGGVSKRAWHEFQRIHVDGLTPGLMLVLILCSLSAFHDNPRDSYIWVAKGLNAVHIRTYANLRDVNVTERPDGWDGKNWSKVKRVDLQGRNLAFADAVGAFLANVDLRGANLTGADLQFAQLQGADLQFTQLQGTALGGAQLQGAALGGANLTGADLQFAQLQDARLQFTRLQGTALRGTQLQGADLGGAQLQDADLQFARLQGADLGGAQLQGAFLSFAQLQGADLRHAALWRAQVIGAKWNYGDLRGADVQPISDAEIETVIAEATKGIPNEASGKAVAERLNAVLRTEERSARPDFPEEWRSKPNVMFDQSDPTPEPFDWGPPSWTTQNDYDEDLATYLGDLACASDVHEALIQGLTRRAVSLVSFAPEARMWPELFDASFAPEARIWPKLFAARLIGPNCPPAKGLPADMRSQLEALAAQRTISIEAPDASPQLSK